MGTPGASGRAQGIMPSPWRSSGGTGQKEPTPDVGGEMRCSGVLLHIFTPCGQKVEGAGQ